MSLHNRGSLITNKTKITGLLGYPVSHSLSPLIHNTLFCLHNLDYVYLPFEIEPKELKAAVLGLRALNVYGCNVTIPYKEEILQYIDILDSNAQLVGAVNTMVFRDNNIYGYNTDVSGFSKALKKEGVVVKDKRTVILGAGGAARALLVSLANDGVKEVNIINRTYQKAKDIKEEFQEKLGITINCLAQNTTDAYQYLREADIVVNSTSVGMSGVSDISILKEKHIFSKQTFIDIIYNPLETPLLRLAAKKGCKTINGIGMLVEQALDSFNIWTGIRPPSGEKIYSLLKEYFQIKK